MGLTGGHRETVRERTLGARWWWEWKKTQEEGGESGERQGPARLKAKLSRKMP